MTPNLGGLSQRAIGATFGVSASTVGRDLAKQDTTDDQGRRIVSCGPVLGLDGKTRPGRRLDTSERDSGIADDRAAGMTMRQIATKRHCSVGTVHRVLNPRAPVTEGTSRRTGATVWSRKVQAVSARCPMETLTADEVAELLGAATFLRDYCQGELILRKS